MEKESTYLSNWDVDTQNWPVEFTRLEFNYPLIIGTRHKTEVKYANVEGFCSNHLNTIGMNDLNVGTFGCQLQQWIDQLVVFAKNVHSLPSTKWIKRLI